MGIFRDPKPPADIELSLDKDGRKIHFYLMKKTLPIVFAALLSSSCTGVQQYVEDYKYTSTFGHFVSDEDKKARWEKICTEIGLTSDDEKWTECLMRAREMDEIRASARVVPSSNPTGQPSAHCSMTNSCF